MQKKCDIIVIGGGMAGLSAASCLVHAGKKVLVLEQNYLPGGCTSSYWRKGFVFESGATTIVGFDEGMPLAYLFHKIGVSIQVVELSIPMRVKLADGSLITRYSDLNQWIQECEYHFGTKNQKRFWHFCKTISDFVWKTSLQQQYFPPSHWRDVVKCLGNLNFEQLYYAPLAFESMQHLLERFELSQNERFVQFVNEQLIITAQNYASQVNVLFGATALCYTLYGNYYINGGLFNLVNPLCEYIRSRGSSVELRKKVTKVVDEGSHYRIEIEKHSSLIAKKVVFAIPLNNALEIFQGNVRSSLNKGLMNATQLNSAFQMGIAFRTQKHWDCLHYQLHLSSKLSALIGSKSLFVSLSHPQDRTRSDVSGVTVASVSTHIHQLPNYALEKQTVAESVLEFLEEQGFFCRKEVIYYHVALPDTWEKWTLRKWGFVGGYPQFFHIKPWQMNEHRLDNRGAYICGDSTYPGQGIPGVTLSGIIAANKLLQDSQ
ncbi:MAG: NAD(P)/FAD-dependent oxidoreductase [Cytophagales bacterium]|nr:NAD(P)/FAD-dependent oxidoreductase [Cytophagales bacterium]MDW8383320.1 NAD(P)/FAD-dependent oxidoreductase [Flammeovirgaceae bacterium]